MFSMLANGLSCHQYTEQLLANLMGSHHAQHYVHLIEYFFLFQVTFEFYNFSSDETLTNMAPRFLSPYPMTKYPTLHRHLLDANMQILMNNGPKEMEQSKKIPSLFEEMDDLENGTISGKIGLQS